MFDLNNFNLPLCTNVQIYTGTNVDTFAFCKMFYHALSVMTLYLCFYLYGYACIDKQERLVVCADSWPND